MEGWPTSLEVGQSNPFCDSRTPPLKRWGTPCTPQITRVGPLGHRPRGVISSLPARGACLRGWWTLGLVLVGGCATPGPVTLDYTTRQILPRDRSAVVDAAEAALVSLGYRIEQNDVPRGVIMGRQVDGVPLEGRAHPGVGLRSTAGGRRIAELRLHETADAVRIYCRVNVQEQATQAHRLFVFDRSGGGDAPSETPIERDAATTTEQNTLWRTVGRDRTAERAILAAVIERTGDEVAEERPPSPAP